MMTVGTSCNYKFDNGAACLRVKDDDQGYCIFHSHQNFTNERINRFWWRLKRLALKGDGDWRGFNFPRINLENITCPVFVTATRASFQDINLTQVNFDKGVDISMSYMNSEIKLQRCTFSEDLLMRNITFRHSFEFSTVVVKKGIIAAYSIFNEDFKVSGSFKETANFSQCHFDKKAEFIQTKTTRLTVSHPMSFSFNGSPIITLSSEESLTKMEKLGRILKWYTSKLKYLFTKAIEWINKTIRKHWKNITQWVNNKLSYYSQRLPHKREGVTKYVLFDEKVVLDNITFSEPKKVLFKGVCLRNATFVGTDLRGVTFIGNDWYQPSLKRNGLKDELRYIEQNNYYEKREMLPNIENTYRNIRFSLEEYKDFGLANDFFIGEMEAKRKQLLWYKRRLFSVPAVYKLISHYGTSPTRCGLFFCIAVIFHALIISYLANTGLYTGLKALCVNFSEFNINELESWFLVIVNDFDSLLKNGRLLDSLTYSIQTMTLQKEKVQLLNPDYLKLSSVSFVDAVFTLIGPILVGLLALTVRTRIKRN